MFDATYQFISEMDLTLEGMLLRNKREMIAGQWISRIAWYETETEALAI